MRRLKPESIKRLRKQDFEDFCWRLLRSEYEKRFSPRAVDIWPPSEEDHPDGGRDIEVVVRDAPRHQSHSALLPDRPMTAWYSCKSKRDVESGGRSWMAQVRDELDPSPRIIDANTQQPVADADERAQTKPKQGRPSDELLEMLAAGGEYHVLVNFSPGPSQIRKLERELRALFGFWIRQSFEREPPDLDGRVRVFDAHLIAEAYNEFSFALDHDLERQLELGEPDFLVDWKRWSDRFAHERALMDFHGDAQRERAIARLGEFLTAPSVDDPVMRFTGAPGVGKTRLVHRALEQHPELHPRVRYTQDIREIEKWLVRASTRELGDRVLVVDEVSALRAGGLADSFATATGRGPRARLIIIGPKELDGPTRPIAIELEALDDAAIRELIIQELRDSEARSEVIDVVAQLSEGFPLHALWLANALAGDLELLREPHTLLTGGDDPWLATARVLAGRPGDDEDAWNVRATLRGKALLLAVLAPDEDWEGLDDEVERSFAEALRVDWGALMQAAQECVQRGLLRRVAPHRRYVSPANLERLILNHLFNDGPSGPPLDPRRLHRRIPRHYARLLERARVVPVSDACRRTLTNAALEVLRNVGPDSVLEDLGRVLHDVVSLAPRASALALREIVAKVGPELVIARLGEDICAALRRLASSELEASEFEAVEATLWMLVDSGFARRSWAELFTQAYATHQPFELRLELLRRRLRAPSPEQRLLALRGLGAILDHTSWTRHIQRWDEHNDGKWLRIGSWGAVHEQLTVAWWELLQLAASDEPEVVDEARGLFRLMDLERGLGLGPEIIEALARSLGEWTAMQRNALRESIWGPEDIARSPGSITESLRGSFELVREALTPRTLEDRLAAQIGRRGEKQRDRELALELVDHPELVRERLSWFGAKQAVRAPTFARVVGEVDADRVLLPILVEDEALSVAPRFVAGYLAGWGRGLDGQALDDWIAQTLARSDHVELLVRTLVEAPGTDRRARLLCSLIERGEVLDEALVRLGYSSWSAEVSTELLDRLIIALSTRGFEAQLQAVGLAVQRLERSRTDLDDALRLAIGELVISTARERLPLSVERVWAQLVAQVSVSGDLGPLQRSLEHASSSNFIGFAHHVVRTLRSLLAANQTTAVWRVVSAALEAGARIDKIRGIVHGADVFAHVPVATVLEWIGDDLDRAGQIAELTQPTRATLDPHARALLCRFGPDSKPARIIEAQAFSPIESPSSPAYFYEQQAANAEGWQRDPDERISSWAAELAAALRERAKRERLDEDYERRYFG